MTQGSLARFTILSVFIVGKVLGECKSIIECEALVTEIPSCNGTKSPVLQCFASACEAINPAVQMNIQAYETAERVLCSDKALKEGFEGMFKCWMTAIACSWMHVVAESAETTRQICIVRRKSMRACKGVGDSSCNEVIGNLTDALNANSSCDAAQLAVSGAFVALALLVGWVLNHK